MSNQKTIHIYQAIAEMERITKAGGEFSFSFFKYDRHNKTGGDYARISRARMRRKAGDDKIKHSSYKLFFTDLDSGKARNCWQVLIVEFNGKKCTL